MTFTPNLDRAIAKHKRATSPTPRLDATIERHDSIRADKGMGGWKETDHPRNAHGQFVTKGSAAMRKGLFEYQALQKPGKHGSAQGVVKHMLKSGEYSMEDIQAAAEAGYQSDTNKVKPGYAKWVRQQMIQHHGWGLPPTPEVSHYKGAGAESDLPSAEVPPPGETPSESGLKTSMDAPEDGEDEPTPMLAELPEAESPHVAPEPAVAPAPIGPKSKYEAGGAHDQLGADLLHLQLEKAKGNFPDHLESDLTDFEKAFPDSETTAETKAVAAGKIDQLTEAFKTEGVNALKKKIADIDYIEPDETMNPEAIDAINDMIHAAKIHVGVKDKKILFGSKPGPAHPASKYIDSLPHSVNIQLGDLGYELNAMPKPIANAFKSELINLNEALHQFDSGEQKMLENYSLFPGADGPFGEQVKNLNNAILQAKTYVGGHDPYKIAQLKKRMTEDAAKLPPEAAGPILDGLKGFDGLSKEKQDAARKTVLMMKEGIESENPSQYFEHIVFPQAAWDVAGLDEAITAVKAAYPPKTQDKLSHEEAANILQSYHEDLAHTHPDLHAHIGNLVNHLPGMDSDHINDLHDNVAGIKKAFNDATDASDLSSNVMDIDPLPDHHPAQKLMENAIHEIGLNPQKHWDYAQNSYAKKNGVQESEPKNQFGHGWSDYEKMKEDMAAKKPPYDKTTPQENDELLSFASGMLQEEIGQPPSPDFDLAAKAHGKTPAELWAEHDAFAKHVAEQGGIIPGMTQEQTDVSLKAAKAYMEANYGPNPNAAPVSSKNSDVDDLYSELTAPADPQASFDNALVTAHKNFPDEVKKHFAGLAYAPHHLNQPIADHINAIDAALKSPNPGAALAAIQPIENPDDYGSINTANAGLEAAQKLYPDPSKQASTASAPGVPATYAKGFKPLGAMAQVPAIKKKVAAHLSGDVAENVNQALYAFQNSSGVGNYNKPVFKAAISHLINAANAGSPQHMLDALEGIPLPASSMQYKKKLAMAIDLAKEQAITKGAVPSAGATLPASAPAAPSAAPAAPQTPSAPAVTVTPAMVTPTNPDFVKQVDMLPKSIKDVISPVVPHLDGLKSSQKDEVKQLIGNVTNAVLKPNGDMKSDVEVKAALAKLSPVSGSGMSVTTANDALEAAKKHYGVTTPAPAVKQSYTPSTPAQQKKYSKLSSQKHYSKHNFETYEDKTGTPVTVHLSVDTALIPLDYFAKTSSSLAGNHDTPWAKPVDESFSDYGYYVKNNILNQDQRDAQSFYQGSGYTSVNKHLLAGLGTNGNSHTQQMIKHLRVATRSSIVPTEVKVTRGLNCDLKTLTGFEDVDDAEGRAFVHPNFCSCSRSETPPLGGSGLVLHFTVPAGVQGLVMAASQNGGEREIILPDNCMFKIDKIQGKHVHVTYLGLKHEGEIPGKGP